MDGRSREMLKNLIRSLNSRIEEQGFSKWLLLPTKKFGAICEIPLFIFYSTFDSFQVRNTFSMDLYNAIKNQSPVRPYDMALLQDFKQQIISALPHSSATKGFIVTSHFGHSFASSQHHLAAFEPIPLMFPENAKAMGAVCLDGSPPTYQFKKGGRKTKTIG
nr:pectin acetylesterase 7-like [Ipomoea batatas]